jgi:hypothetical protein
MLFVKGDIGRWDVMGMMGMRDGVGGREYGCIHKRYITILMNQ